MEDTRGIDLKADNFKTQLTLVINKSNLPPSLVLYILKDIYYEVNDLYKQSVSKQYQDFCETEKEEQTAAQENDESAAADSDNIDDK